MATLKPLVTTDWLGDRLHDEELRIADCRFYLANPAQGPSEYERGHIPTAKYFSIEDDLTGASGPGRHPLPDPTEFADRLRQFGIGNEHTVIIYDDGSSTSAARMWWMLRSLGHQRVAVLDGGWTAWSSEPRSVTSEVPVWEPAELKLAVQWSGTVTGDEVAAAQGLLLVDSRAPARYRGDEEPIDPVAGHIPGAVNVPYQDNNAEGGLFLAQEDLKQRFSMIAQESDVVFYCGSGVTACNNILAAEAAGYSDTLLYEGSWSDWCARGGEVATSGTS